MGIIGTIRKHSWLPVAIVAIAIVLFIIGDLTRNYRSGDTTVGKVDGATLSYQRFNELEKEMEDNYKRQYQTAQVPTEVGQQMRNQVWENFVDETLLGKQMEKAGIEVLDEEEYDMYVGTFIDPSVRQLFTNPENGQFDARQVSAFMESVGDRDQATQVWWNGVQKELKNNRQRQKYFMMLSSGMYMPQAIAKQVDSYGATRADVRIAMQTYQSIADEAAPVEEADYQAYYNEHRAEYRVAEELRDLEYVVFAVVPSKEDLDAIKKDVDEEWGKLQAVADSDLVYFVNSESDRSYDSTYRTAESFPAPFDAAIAASNSGDMLEPQVVMSNNEWMMAKVQNVAMRPDSLRASLCLIYGGSAEGMPRTGEVARERADSAVAAFAAGKAPAEVVASYSDEKSLGEEGDLGWMADGGYDLNFGNAYLRLNERIINTPTGKAFVADLPNRMGYAVVMVTEKTAPIKKYRVASVVRGIFPSATTINARSAEASMLAANNRTEEVLIAAAREQNMPVRNARVAAGSENIANGVEGSREIVRWAFGKDVEKGNVSDKVFRCGDLFVVVAVKDVISPEYATLDQVRPMIENQVRIEKKAQKMMADMAEASKQSKDINAIASKLGVAVDTLTGIGFADYYMGRYGMEPKVLAKASTAKGLVGPIKGANGVYMMQIDGQTTNEPQQSDATKRRMEQGYMQKLNALGTVLRERAKIVEQRVRFF